MSKSSLKERLITLVIFVPIALMFTFVNFGSFFLLNASLVFFAAFASKEMNEILFKTYGLRVSSFLAIILGIYPTIITYVMGIYGLLGYFSEIYLVSFILITFIFSLALFSNNEFEVNNILSKVGVSAILFFYPNFMFTYFVRITFLEDSWRHILLIAFVVFTNDGFAYVLGRLLGKFFPKRSLIVSPNKTLIGFFGGFLGTTSSFLVAYYLNYSNLNLFFTIIISSIFSLLVIMGDLLESSFKRSAKVKDSGTLIRGRGGVLDSCDSFFFVIPLFYYCIINFF